MSADDAMAEPTWTYEPEAATPAPTFGDHVIRLITVVVGIALVAGVAFNIAVVGVSPWLLLAVGLGLEYGIVAALGIVLSALIVLRLLGRRGWTTWGVAVATLPGWLIAAVLVRVFGASAPVGIVDLVVASLVALAAAIATGWVVANWNQQLSKR